MKQILEQLLGGLFDQTHQKETLRFHMANIDSSAEAATNSPTGWGIWPTTRQGDVLEKRMADMDTKFDGIVVKMRFCLHEIGAGLFNYDTQRETWREYRDLLSNVDYEDDDTKDSSKHGRYPTTRQGDAL